MKTSICFQCKCQALCPTGQVQPREATVSAITACSRFQPKDKQTHGDKLRAKPDDELATILAEAECPSDLGGKGKCKDGTTDLRICRECWLDWLREEESDG